MNKLCSQNSHILEERVAGRERDEFGGRWGRELFLKTVPGRSYRKKRGNSSEGSVLGPNAARRIRENPVSFLWVPR